MSTVDDLWLSGLRHTPSANCDKRPDGVDPELLVIHNISLPPNHYQGSAVEDFFLNRLDCETHPYFDQLRNVKVSAHLFIRRNGQAQQFVALNRRAWHAGQSEFQGRSRCNDFSIGIELEGSDHQPFEDPQYASLISLITRIQEYYPAIHADRIVGHSDIAPGRKTDPGPCFDWARLRAALI